MLTWLLVTSHFINSCLPLLETQQKVNASAFQGHWTVTACCSAHFCFLLFYMGDVFASRCCWTTWRCIDFRQQRLSAPPFPASRNAHMWSASVTLLHRVPCKGVLTDNIWPPWERGVCRCGSPTGGLISMLPNNESFTPRKKIFTYPKHTEEFIIEMTVLLPGSFSGLITRFDVLGFQGILREFIQVFLVRCSWLCVLIGILKFRLCLSSKVSL